MTETENNVVGRVLRASTRGFDCGTHSNSINDNHNFGAYVKAPIANADDRSIYAVGIIYKVEIKDDQLVSELVMGEYVPFNVLADQRENRMIPIEIKVLNIGYNLGNGSFIQSMPPRPPMSLSDVVLCTPEEVHGYTQYFDFFRLVLSASEVPSEDLLAAAIRHASLIYTDTETRYDFLVRCGRQLARDLSNDLKRLNYMLSLIRP